MPSVWHHQTRTKPRLFDVEVVKTGAAWTAVCGCGWSCGHRHKTKKAAADHGAAHVVEQ